MSTSSSPTARKGDIRLQKLNDAETPLQPEGDEYDPHLHRSVPHPTTNTETLIHLLKGSLGTGILAMPKAFHQAGYLSGIINTILIGFLCTYGLHVLVRSQYILCKRRRVPILTYPISMKIALEEGPPCFRWLAPFAIVIVDGFLIVYQLGICCVYIVFVAQNVQKFLGTFEFFAHISLTVYILCLIPPFIALACIRNLKLLAPFSTLANVLTFLGIGFILKYIFEGIFDPKKPHPDYDPINTDFSQFPLFFGTTLFAIEAVGVVVSLENNMKTPKSFGARFGVLNVGMAVITLLYAAFGFLGFWCYGKDSEDSVTLNLPKYDILSKVIQGCFTVATFISFGLQCYVPVEIIWGNYLSKLFDKSRNALLWEYVVRFIIVGLTFGLAVSVPYLALFISLFGALCLSVLGIAFPAVMEICVLYPDRWGLFYNVILRNIVLILIGSFALITGTHKSVVDIIGEIEIDRLKSMGLYNITTTTLAPNP